MRLLEEGRKLFALNASAISTAKCEVYPIFNHSNENPNGKVEKAIKTYATTANGDNVIGLIDTSISRNASAGALFCDTKFYYTDFPHKHRKIWYDEIKSISVISKQSGKCVVDKSIEIVLKDEKKYLWLCTAVNMLPVVNFIRNMIELCDNPGMDYNRLHIKANSSFTPGADAAGIAAGARGTVNKVFEEEKFHAHQGHGFAAERANDLADRMHGHEAKIVGDDNSKNGADRIVDGVFIQSKYCATGTKCIDSCFENNGNGAFRYIGKNGNPMVIEVPNDESIYNAAVERMKQKIINGQVPGVTNPDDAVKFVKRGTVTYKQAINIAKAGTIDSLRYDAQQAAVISASAFGVSAVVTFAASLWNDDKFDIALKKATFSGLKVGGTAFVTSILASQLSKAGLNSLLVPGSEAIIKAIGPKGSAVLINGFRNGANIHGAPAMKSAAKLLRGNAIVGAATFVVLSLDDVINIFRGRISASQLFKDLANTGATILGGSGGYLGGAALGSLVVPGVGTVVGGLVGALALGAGAGKGTDYVVGKFVEDDAKKMVSIIEKVFQELSEEYILTSVEAEKLVDKLSSLLDGKKLQEMFASTDRAQFSDDYLRPLVEIQVRKRHHIVLPTDDDMRLALRDVLECIADEQSVQPA